MLRLSRWRGFGAVVLALWFGLFTAESLWVRACPMHDGMSHAGGNAMAGHVAHGTTPAMQVQHAGHGQHAMPGHATHQLAEAGPVGGASGDEQAPPRPMPCNCLGACLGGAVLALVSPPVVLALAHDRWAAAPERPLVEGVRRDAPRRLPFAIPPPPGEAAA